MSKLPFLFAATFLPLVLVSQNYQTVNSGRTALYSGFGTKAIRIDSVHVGGDSVLYPFTTIQQLDNNCFTVDQTSWIGPKIIVMNNGQNLFINRNNDTITINTRAEVNESWIAFFSAEGPKIVATVTAKEKLTFLGLEDSVKTIGFQAYDANNQPVNHSINQKTIQLSKEYGFKRTMNFYLFPDLESPQLYETLISVEVIGMTNPQVGIQNLTWLDVFDYQPEDEIHILETSSEIDIFSNTSRSQIKKLIVKYLTRNDTLDGIKYTYSLEQGIQNTVNGTTTNQYMFNTRTTSVFPNPQFDKLPGEPVISSEWIFVYRQFSNVKIEPDVNHRYTYDAGYPCLGTILANGCTSESSFRKGLGGPYYSCENLPAQSADRTLVYYKKGNTTWGTPLTIVGIENEREKREMELFPNPANDLLFVKNITPDSNFEILDITGKSVGKGTLSTPGTISVQNLGKGIYFLIVTDSRGAMKTGRFVK
jgi:hypothetical protein